MGQAGFGKKTPVVGGRCPLTTPIGSPQRPLLARVTEYPLSGGEPTSKIDPLRTSDSVSWNGPCQQVRLMPRALTPGPRPRPYLRPGCGPGYDQTTASPA